MLPNPSRPATDRGDFAGFTPLDANFIYCPNQFFDVCLRHSSRGTVRLVAYTLLKTLQWLDESGEPLETTIEVAHSQLISEAGISKGAVKPSLEDAFTGNLLEPVTRGSSHQRGSKGARQTCSLKWSQQNYTTQPDEFSGFFMGEGNRTPVPMNFFTEVVPFESLAVIKVVGTVLRHTVGYQNQFGGRREHAELSVSTIQRHTDIKSRRIVVDALAVAIERGYIVRVQDGVFGNIKAQQTGAMYAPAWQQKPVSRSERFKKCTRESVQKVNQKGFKKVTRKRTKSEPEERFKKCTSIEKQQEIHSQTTNKTAAAVLDEMISTGMEEGTAQWLLQFDQAECQKQLAWLPERYASNPAGLLRKAIVDRWTQPKVKPVSQIEVQAKRELEALRELPVATKVEEVVDSSIRWAELIEDTVERAEIEQRVRASNPEILTRSATVFEKLCIAEYQSIQTV